MCNFTKIASVVAIVTAFASCASNRIDYKHEFTVESEGRYIYMDMLEDIRRNDSVTFNKTFEKYKDVMNEWNSRRVKSKETFNWSWEDQYNI